MNGTSTRPEKEFRVGAVRAAIWSNPRRTAGGQSFDSHRIQLERTYKDSQGNFKTTQSLEANDIPKAIVALQKSYEYLLFRAVERESGTEMEDDLLYTRSPA
jgi:hypothetical protein